MKVVGNTEKDSNALHISKVFHKKSKDEPSQNEEKPEEDENSDSMKVPKVSKVDIEKVGSMKVMGDLAKNDENGMKIPGPRHHEKKIENVEEKSEDKETDSLEISKVANKDDFDMEKVGSMKVMDNLANNDEKTMKIPGLRPHDKKTENAEDETVKGLKVKDKKVEKADKKSFRIAKVAHKKPKASGKVLPTLIFFTLEEIFFISPSVYFSRFSIIIHKYIFLKRRVGNTDL